MCLVHWRWILCRKRASLSGPPGIPRFCQSRKKNVQGSDSREQIANGPVRPLRAPSNPFRPDEILSPRPGKEPFSQPCLLRKFLLLLSINTTTTTPIINFDQPQSQPARQVHTYSTQFFFCCCRRRRFTLNPSIQSRWPPQRSPPARPRSMPSSRRPLPAPPASSAVSPSTPDSPLPVPSAAP